VLQLFVVNRLIARFGLRGTHIMYSVLMTGALVANLLPMTLGLAIFDRFVETELRFGLRNPIMQLITNRFSKPLRTRVRSWTRGGQSQKVMERICHARSDSQSGRGHLHRFGNRDQGGRDPR